LGSECDTVNKQLVGLAKIVVNPKNGLQAARHYPITMITLVPHPPPPPHLPNDTEAPQAGNLQRRAKSKHTTSVLFVTVARHQLTGKLPTQLVPLHNKQEYIKSQISQLVKTMALFSPPVHFRPLRDPLVF
jgi:hypothetical protein